MTQPSIAFNPADATQIHFLSALALGETGTLGHNSTFTGFGGADLSGRATDPFGFPQSLNTTTSSAAGTYQFVRETWDNVASKYNLNFANPADQNAGAWYLAQDTFAHATGGQSLEAALQSGDLMAVQNALSSVWPSVIGNPAAPQGLANNIAAGIGADIANPGAASGMSADGSSVGGLFGAIENWFERFGLIVIGIVILAIAGWALLQKGEI